MIGILAAMDTEVEAIKNIMEIKKRIVSGNEFYLWYN